MSTQPNSSPQRSNLPVPGATSNGPALTSRRSLLTMRQSFGAPSTPRRGSITPTSVPTMPTPTAAGRYAPPSSQAKRGKALEIGDEVVMDGTSLIGVLRHLGPVTFKPGDFAGLELIGSSTGKGKNDGSVQGVQYFACDAGNGIFCPAHKVSLLSTDPPTEATARPQSALSSRSGRSSVAGENRPPSTTPGSRSRSNTASTPARAPSRSALSRPTSSLAGRQGSTTNNGTTSRLLPRKSIADGLADEEGRRRAKTSAEEAERAEGRITAGSRAHRFLNMNARDLGANGSTAAAADLFGSAAVGKPASPVKGGRPSSPLKDSLLGGNRTQSGLPAPKSRISTGATGMQTPRSAKARLSAFGAKGGSTGMLPPSAPTIGGGPEHGRKSMGGHESLAQSSGVPRTPSRMSNTSSRADEDGPMPMMLQRAKNQMLLEELDLTPKRNSHMRSPSDALRDSTNDEGSDGGLGGYALTTDREDGDEAAQAVVPLSLYEESTLELARLKAQLTLATKQQQQSQAQGQAEMERAKVRAQEEARKESEEERRVEREDEARRRRELEAKEREARERGETLAREVKRLTEEHKRADGEREERVRDVEARLQESEKLVGKLKGTLDNGGATSKEIEGRLKAKDLELEQLNERIARVVEERDRTREEHLREIDDLKAAGEEAFEIFQKEQALNSEIVQETEGKMAMLEARAQEAIAEVERQRDEALRGIRGDGTSVAEIDHQSLQEQLSQAQKRVVSLEDQLAESSMVMQQEREANIKRKDRFVESEGKLKAEVARIKAEYRRATGSEAEAKGRIDELTEALDEARTALENERAELEILRTEALVIGGDQQGQPLGEREKGRLESEVERLTGLLEGARSGKREAARQVEQSGKEVAELHSLLDEVRSHLKVVEADKLSLEAALASTTAGSDGASIGDLQRAVERKSKEVETLQRSSLPLPEQVTSLLASHRKEMQIKEEEVFGLRRKLDESVKRQSSSRYSLTVPSSNGGGSEVGGQSPSLSGETSGVFGSPSPRNSKRFSTASNQSRKSRSSLEHMIGNPENMLKELAGLRSIVNTLNQELTESKVNSMQQERELKSQVDTFREEARKWQLTVESLQGAQSGSAGGEQGSKQASAIDQQLQVERKLQEAQQQVHRLRAKLEATELKRREEVDKLNQDISELEALCEATVWRREEQDAKREELERQVAKLQRSLDRALNGERREERSSMESAATDKDQVTCDDCGESGHVMGADCPYSKDDLLF